MIELSIVLPVYNCIQSIEPLVSEIEKALGFLQGNYEVILVDDRSPDSAWDLIQSLAQKNRHIKGVRLSRNYGQHFAITAGLSKASGACAIVMDCDLQDHPRYIPELLVQFKKGSQVVFTSKNKRKHSLVKNAFSKLFFKIFNVLTNQTAQASDDIGNYSLLSRKAYLKFLDYKDVHRHYLMIVRNLGFTSTVIQIDHLDRPFGKSSYNLLKLVQHAVNGIISQSNAILYAAVFAGVVYFISAILASIYYLYRYLTNGALAGFTSLVLLLLFSTGIILIFMGLIGVYIAKIFDQVRARPLYIVEDTLNLIGDKE